MNKLMGFIGIVLFFLLGWYSCLVFSQMNFEKEFPFVDFSSERSSPSNHIIRDQILVTDDYVLIKVKNAVIASYANTNSMDPVIDVEANGIEVRPNDENDIKVGDIITYNADWTSGLVVHRVIEVNEDENGIYYLTKGDNSPRVDPQKIRFDDVEYVLIGAFW